MRAHWKPFSILRCVVVSGFDEASRVRLSHSPLLLQKTMSTSKTLLREMADSLRSATTMTSPAGMTIVITGCSSGIGLYAAKLLHAANPHHRLVLVARTHEKAAHARTQVVTCDDNEGSENFNSNVIPMVCDHTSISSIHQFCQELRQTVVSSKIDALCLNAATLVKSNEPEFTVDGMEVTFQTNHLAPFLIANLIHDLIHPHGRVVVTGSGLHKGPTFGSFRGITDETTTVPIAKKGFATIDGNDFHYKASYASSKLCNMAFTMALNRRLQKLFGQDCVANSFSPGLIPESGLFRHQNPYLLKAFSFAMKHVFKVSTSVEWGGGALAWMATADESGKKGGEYWAAPMGAALKGAQYGLEFCPSDIAQEALDVENQERLWKLSLQLAGIPKTTL